MKRLVLFQAMLCSCLVHAEKLALVIECDNEVSVYMGSDIDAGTAIIEFEKNGELIRETGTVSVRLDKSLVANSNSAVVYGNPQGTGYYMLAPSRKPQSGDCLSANF